MADRVNSIRVSPQGGGAPSKNNQNMARRLSAFVPTYVPPKTVPKYVEIVNGPVFSHIVTALTVFALFGDDFRLAATQKSADPVFFSISIVALVFFTIELVVNSLYKVHYLLGFYFTLDFFATLSLIPDIGWLWDIITGVEDNGQGGQTEALKAGRASRAGTKAGRIVRVIRIIRMVRIVKLYKQTSGNKADDIEEQMKAEPSMVGKKLTELTTRRVIILVLLMLIVLPIFDGGYSEPDTTYLSNGIAELHMLAQVDTSATSGVKINSTPFFDQSVKLYATQAGPVFHLEMQGITPASTLNVLKSMTFKAEDDANKANSPADENPLNGWTPAKLWSSVSESSNYRTTEAAVFTAEGCYDAKTLVKTNSVNADGDPQCFSVVYFDATSESAKGGVMSILKTFFVMIVLGGGVMMFTRDAERLVIIPIERMVQLVKKLAENPLANTKKAGPVMDDEEEAKQSGYETAILEQTLSKIGALLQVGFGEAGAEIIGKNMNAGGAVDPMIPGKKITCVFGFCDIRMFTDTTECLQEEVMVYVNKIGQIVHSCTHEYYGAANKNIGDAFLLAWKICDDSIPPGDDFRIATKGGRNLTLEEMCDSALAAFLRIVVELDNANSNGPLSAYLTHPAVLKRFGPDFRIKMGFGMHVGWAIEGAIGSRYKIDASYLSPNVNMAARLEAATKQFRTPLLFSHWFIEMLSPGARALCRRIDCVTVKGSEQPMTLYTYDVVNMVPFFGKAKFDADGVRLPVDFEKDAQFRDLQQGIHADFYSTFDAAVAKYLEGDWQGCRDGLNASLQLKPEDGPAVSLMEVIQNQNFTAPSGWAGFRELTEK